MAFKQQGESTHTLAFSLIWMLFAQQLLHIIMHTL